MSEKKIAVIIGAGPAGLTAAYELLEYTDIQPVIYEASDTVGGICRTVNYKGNRMDIGGHRFFSKSDRIIQWWEKFLPIEAKGLSAKKFDIHYHHRTHTLGGDTRAQVDPEKTDKVMLVRNRYSRILYQGKFYDYPIAFNMNTLLKLGWRKTLRIGISYLKVKLFPKRPEVSLRDFLTNRFGKELYVTFFKSYTEKVWGTSPKNIKAEWGAQRIKGLSLGKAIINQAKTIFSKDPTLTQKKVETTLIQRFLYPKYGPGQMWDEVADQIRVRGGKIFLNARVAGFEMKDSNSLAAVTIRDERNGHIDRLEADYFFSTMPIKELIQGFGEAAPAEVREVAEGLMYRDFITVGVLIKNFKTGGKSGDEGGALKDNWIYIQESHVKVGRLQIFNNWSPYLVKDKNTVWIGMEYFCHEGDDLWRKSDDELKKTAVDELVRMKLIDPEDVMDQTVIRMLKTYPAYFGSYDRLAVVTQFTDRIENLFLIGRNGMHRYNNQDHSMLTAMEAVQNIVHGIKTKDNLWSINAEEDYHEEKNHDKSQRR